MIDINNERLISISDVPKHLPRRPNGKTCHISCAYRWIQKGINGIRLESAKIAGTTYTSLEAIQRWSDALTYADKSSAEGGLQTPKSRERQIDKAAKQVNQELKN